MHGAPRLYLSATRHEFHAWRNAAIQVLRRFGAGVTEYSDLSVGGKVETADLLAGMEECAAMICLVPSSFHFVDDQQLGLGLPANLPMLDNPDAVSHCELAAATKAGKQIFLFTRGATVAAGRTETESQSLPEPSQSDDGGKPERHPLTDMATFVNELTEIVSSIVLHSWGLIIPLEMPPEAEHFHGRSEEVAWLERHLRNAEPWKRISLIGAGGTGKSAIVREALERVAPAEAPFALFPGGIYLHDFYAAPSCRAMVDGILASAGLAETPEEERDAVVTNLLNHERCLVCAEGVEKLRDPDKPDNLTKLFNLCGRAVVLLTSRHTLDAWQTTSRSIGRLPVADAAALIAAHATEGSGVLHPGSVFAAIAELLGGHPLALHLAGALLRHSAEPPEDFLAALRAEGFGSMDEDSRRVESLRFLFRHHAERLSPAARNAWFALCLHGLSPIDVPTIADCLGCVDNEAQTALAELVARSVASKTSIPGDEPGRTDQAWRLRHARFAEWGRSRLGDCAVPADDIVRRWKSHWFAFFESCWNHQSVSGTPVRHNLVVEHLYAFADSLSRIEGPDSPDLSQAINDAGHICFFMGRDEDARRFYERAVVIAARLLGAAHPDTLTRQENLVRSLERSRTAEAEALQRVVLEMRIQTAGREEPATLAAMLYLAQLIVVRGDRGDRKEAKRLFQEAVELHERVHGVFGAETIYCRFQFADFLYSIGENRAAATLYQQNLEAIPAADSTSAPEFSLGNYATILQAGGRLREAETVWRRALAQLLLTDPDSLAALDIRSNLAIVLAEQGAFAEAESFAAEVAELCARHFDEADAFRKDAEAHLAEIRSKLTT